MNPVQRLASTKAGEHSARRPMQPQPQKRNPLSAFGNWMMGGATAKDLTSPAWWLKGLADETNKNLIQPVYRTASGTNLRTALSPSSTLNQRINAVGEDALNVIGLIPGAGPAARASVAAEQAGARVLGRAKGIKPAAQTIGNKPSPYVTQKIQQATTAQQEALEKAKGALSGNRPEYDFDRDDFIRLWHTGMQGEQLPFPLKSVEDASNLPTRRGGGGSTNLLDGGLYTTDSGTTSASYAKDIKIPPPHHLPTGLRDKVVDLQGVQTDFMYDAEEVARQSNMYSMDLLDSAVSIDDVIPNKNAFETRSQIPPSLIKAYDSSTTYRDFLNAVPPELYDDALKQIGVPLKFVSDEPTILNMNTRTGMQNLYADSDNPLYFISNEPTTVFGPRLQQISINKRQDPIRGYMQQIEEQEALLKAAQRLYFKKIEVNPGSALNTKYAQDHLALVAGTEKRIAQLQDWIKHYQQPSPNDVYKVSPGFTGTPGQNYFDLPIERSLYFPPGQNSPRQNITSINNLPAFDIGEITPQQKESLRTALQKYLSSYSVEPEDIDIALEQIDNLGLLSRGDLAANNLVNFRGAMSNSWNAVENMRPLTETVDDKEKLYEFLKNELNYASMPHPGGATTKNTPHQAVVFSRPELLPQGRYLPPTSVDFNAAMKQYNDSLVRKYFNERMLQSGNFVDIPQTSPNITAAQRMANRMALAGSAQSVRNR
jgi:hypothetical protein